MGVDDGLGEKETEGWNERKRWEKGKTQRGRDYMMRGEGLHFSYVLYRLLKIKWRVYFEIW